MNPSQSREQVDIHKNDRRTRFNSVLNYVASGY